MRKTSEVALIGIALWSLSTFAHASPRDVALTIDRSGGLIADARVEGTGPYHFLIDTGSSRSVISSSLRERLRAPVVAKSEMVSAGATERVLLAKVHTLSIGVAAVSDLLVIVLPDRVLRSRGGEIDGIVGQDLLSRFSYLVDRDGATLTWNPTAAERSAGGVALRLVASEGRLLVELPQRRNQVLMMVPDTGADAIVIFAGARAIPLPLSSGGSGVALAGLGPSTKAHAATLRSFRIGDAVRRQQRAVVADVADGGSDGLLPMKIFRRFCFDSAARVLTVWW